MIRVCEVFESVQGEGLTVGAPSLFIRTGRCSVSCKFCDTKYSWNSGRDYSAEEIREIVEKTALPDVIITGGEPLEEPEIDKVLLEISQVESVRRITLETCGHFFRELPTQKLHLVVSPKPLTMGVEFPFREVSKFLENYENVELKFTLFSEEDLERIKEFLKEYRKLINFPVVLQPLHHPEEEYRETCRRVVKMVLKERELLSQFEIRVIPQVHKLIGVK